MPIAKPAPKKTTPARPRAAAKKVDAKPVDESTYYFFRELDNTESKNLIEFLMKNAKKEPKQRPPHLTLVINSPGGDLHAALAIVDMIQSSPTPIKSLVTGMAASAASLIHSACHQRIMTRRSYLMTHQYSTATWGKYHELKHARSHEDHVEKVMVDTYVQTTKLPEATVRSALLNANDVYLSAEQCKEFGLVDLII